MKFENVIKQQRFASPLQKVVLNVLYTSNWLRDRQTEVFAGESVTPAQFNIMRILKGSHPQRLSPSDIKEVMLDKQPDVTRLVDKLVALGYVKRESSSEDRRRMEVWLTSAGLRKLDVLNEKVMVAASELQGRLTAKESETLSSLLDKLRG
jgi:MarR family 2-MHQ and catechol resistance regulon transcriptional repressor